MTDPDLFPFNPEIHVYIPDGLYAIGSGTIGVDSSLVEISSSIDYTIDLGGNQC